jgi:Kelch motif
VLLGVAYAVLGASGGSSSDRPASNPHTLNRPAPPRTPRLVARLSPNRLPAAVSGEAAVAGAGGVLVIGGLNSADVSTDSVFRVDPTTGRAASAGALAEPLHDAAAAQAPGRVLVFGGGSLTELDSVESLSAGGHGALVGRLPSARSDLSAIAVGAYVYVLGGYDGQAPIGAVLRTTEGHTFTNVATLPVPFRYAAVAAVGNLIYTFGGELANGSDSNAIQVLDTSTGRASVIGRLTRPVSHACAVTLGGRILILGGRSHEAATNRILAFDPASRRLSLAGRLPLPVTNSAAARAGNTVYLLGGLDAAGKTLASVIKIQQA